jgi:hypothetical protein
MCAYFFVWSRILVTHQFDISVFRLVQYYQIGKYFLKPEVKMVIERSKAKAFEGIIASLRQDSFRLYRFEHA